MTHALLPQAREEMDAILSDVAKHSDTPIEAIRRHGKLPKILMEVRREAIRRMHKTGKYRRADIASFFGLSIYTITSSLEDEMKDRPVPFTPEEDEQLLSMHCEGKSIDQIQAALPSRSPSALRRRITNLRAAEDGRRPFPRPSYESPIVPMSIMEMARKENERMLRNL